ncbi:MAG: outer membrane protein transport protein, partial [Gammaproteobacteria bacterium]|nr:outer membrane protein transport protein [Gammaproteobacteria bacterium]
AQYFRAAGLEDFSALGFTSPGREDGLTGHGWSSSFGGGYRRGWLGKFMDEKFRVGVNYSSRVWMDNFDRYTGLFAEQGDFDIPENYTVGLAYDLIPALTVAFDVQRINWHDVRSMGNPGPDASDPSAFFSLCPGEDKTPCLLGGPLGLGFGWENQTVYKLGVNLSLNEKWDLRAGYNYGKSPIQDEEVLFNMLAPATPEHHLTIGAGWAMAEHWQLDMNFMYAYLNTIKGPTAFGQGGAIVEGDNAAIAMKQYSLGATIAYKF